LPQLLWDWHGYTARYSAFACDLWGGLALRNTLPPRNAHNAHSTCSVPWLNTKRTSASAWAAPLHLLV